MKRADINDLASGSYNNRIPDSDPLLVNGRALILSEMADILCRRIRDLFVRNLRDFLETNGDKFAIVIAPPESIGFKTLDLARDIITYNSPEEAAPLLESHLRCQEKFPSSVLSEIEFTGDLRHMVRELCLMDMNNALLGPWVSTLWQTCCKPEATPLDQAPEFARLETHGDDFFVARRFRVFRHEAAVHLRAYLSHNLALRSEFS